VFYLHKPCNIHFTVTSIEWDVWMTTNGEETRSKLSFEESEKKHKKYVSEM
jgi:hypothetical protein